MAPTRKNDPRRYSGGLNNVLFTWIRRITRGHLITTDTSGQRLKPNDHKGRVTNAKRNLVGGALCIYMNDYLRLQKRPLIDGLNEKHACIIAYLFAFLQKSRSLINVVVGLGNGDFPAS